MARTPQLHLVDGWWFISCCQILSKRLRLHSCPSAVSDIQNGMMSTWTTDNIMLPMAGHEKIRGDPCKNGLFEGGPHDHFPTWCVLRNIVRCSCEQEWWETFTWTWFFIFFFASEVAPAAALAVARAVVAINFLRDCFVMAIRKLSGLLK